MLALNIFVADGEEEVAFVVKKEGDGGLGADDVVLYDDATFFEELAAVGVEVVVVGGANHDSRGGKVVGFDCEGFASVGLEVGGEFVFVIKDFIVGDGDVVGFGEVLGEGSVAVEFYGVAGGAEGFDAVLVEVVDYASLEGAFSSDKDEVYVVLFASR